MSSKILALISFYLAINIALCIEKPSYEVLKTIDESVEIRKYAPSKWVSTKMIASCENIETNKKTLFQRLFAYISGQNDKNQKIDMTAPVLTEVINMGQSCQIKMRFLIPKVLQNNTPVPTGDAVLEQFPEMTVAVNQFSGLATMNDYIAHHALLVQRLGNDAVQYDTTTMLTAGYNAPYQIINRTNEVWFRKN